MEVVATHKFKAKKYFGRKSMGHKIAGAAADMD
jgi:hypothetical protein